MPKQGADEQFPLLLVLVGDEEISQNNKRLFGKGRFNGITSGATAIITEWPNYLSVCWMTALICGVALFTISVLLNSLIAIEQHPRLPRCSSTPVITANKTIHLVHTHKWYPLQLQLLHNISAAFPNYTINLILVNKARKNSNETRFNETKNLPNVKIEQKTFREVFKNSPLFLKWSSLNHHMRLFAVRVLQVWQWGGLSFELPEVKTLRKVKNVTNYIELKIQSLVKTGRDRYEKLEDDIVSVDANGLHMETKTPCHAFFGKVLTKLKQCVAKTTPRDVLSGPIWTFCKAGAIDKEFCHFKSVAL